MRACGLLLILCAPCAALTLNTVSLREYELKHGRVAMLALPTLTALSTAGVEDPVRWLSEQSVDVQLVSFAVAAVIEAGATLPRFEGVLELKSTVKPGQFPPLGPSPSEEVALVELAIARSAMLITFGCLISTFL